MGAFPLRCRYLRCMLGWLEISVEVLVGKTLPVTAYRTDKWSKRKGGGEGERGGSRRKLHAALKWWSVNSSGLSASGVPIMRLIVIADTAEWPTGDRSPRPRDRIKSGLHFRATDLLLQRGRARDLEHRILQLFVHSPPTVRRCAEDDRGCSANTRYHIKSRL